MGLGASWTIPIRDGHPTCSDVPITVFGIAGATGRIKSWDIDIHILLENLVPEQVKPFQSEDLKFHPN